VFTNNPVFAETIAMVANHGQKIKYKHEIVGINSRLDTIQAAILNVKLKYLPEFEKARRSCADFYDRELANIPDLAAPLRAQNSSHVFHQYTLTLKNETQRNALKKHLEEASIPTMIYYPTPLHQQQAYYQNISMPLTEDLCKRVLSLPIHTEMEQDQLIYITGEIKKYFNL
jgi:dTDP-4-amino-4,6-dideoxygalactose transaminase